MSEEKNVALQEYSLIGDERRHLEETQLKYLSMSIAATALLFAYAATSLKPENSLIISLTFIVPIFLIVPVWVMFLKKAQRLTYLAGYEQIIESFLLNKISFFHFGIENTIKGIANRTFFKYHFDEEFFLSMHQSLIELMEYKKIKKTPNFDEFCADIKGNLLNAEKQIKMYLGYKSWSDLTNKQKFNYFTTITFEPDRTGTYWLVIYRICFMLTYASFAFSVIAKLGNNISFNEETISNFTILLNADSASRWNTIGFVLIYFLIFIIISYIISRITADHYELHKGIFSYESNYDLWCVVLSVKKLNSDNSNERNCGNEKSETDLEKILGEIEVLAKSLKKQKCENEKFQDNLKQIITDVEEVEKLMPYPTFNKKLKKIQSDLKKWRKK